MFSVLVVVWLLLIIGAPVTKAETVAPELSFTTVARSSIQVQLPLLTGPDDEVLQGRVNGSTLKYGTLTKVVGWTYEYVTIYELVDPAGCTDIASYTLSDGANFSISANIVIQIGECREEMMMLCTMKYRTIK
jgi:hypothetical protein